MPAGDAGLGCRPDDSEQVDDQSGLMTNRTLRHVPSGFIALFLLLSGCADDSTSSAPVRSASSVAQPAEAEYQKVEDFCGSYLAADALVGPALAAGGDAISDLQDAFSRVNGIPAELDGAFEVVHAQVAFLAGREGAEPSEGEFDDASTRITEWVIERCALTPWGITADDYQFETVETLQPGSYEIQFRNLGDEFHEAQVVQINQDVNTSLANLLELDESELLARVTPLTGAFAAPGGADRQILTLTEEGRYGIVCLIPVGSIPAAVESGREPTGRPHFAEGMFVEFVVRDGSTG